MSLSYLFLTVIALSASVSSISIGDKVDNWLKHPVGNPEELGNLFEGDIILPNTKRVGSIDENSKWPKGIVPYTITGFEPDFRRVIVDAMKAISTRSCIKFIPKGPQDKDYVQITSKHKGCNSFIGKRGGPQTLNLQVPACLLKPGTVIHELLHTVGFFHEQNRYDRDDYVEIRWDNILEDKKYNFEKKSEQLVTHYGIEYDYGSVMHYSDTAFSSNGNLTIAIKGAKKDISIGQRESLSDLDARKVNAMYNCTR